jgi:Uma2 family endonuclease
MNMITQTLMTAEQFFELPDEPCRRDLVEGEVWTVAAAGAEHGVIAGGLYRLLSNHVEVRQLGLTFAAETGFTLARNPDTVLAGDVAFVRADRIPDTGIPEDFWEIAPDLVVEIVSPGDRPQKVAKKVALYLQAGVRLVWVVYPRKHTVVVHEPGTEPRALGDADTLEGAAVLPGFTCSVQRLWVR